MSKEEKMPKAKTVLLGEDTVEETRDGLSPILTKQRKSQLRDIPPNGASISIDHSTLDQDFQ
jgi:hypothetical protein